MGDISDSNHHSGHHEMEAVTYCKGTHRICWGPRTMLLISVNTERPGHGCTGKVAGHKALEGITRRLRDWLVCWDQGSYIHERKG